MRTRKSLKKKEEEEMRKKEIRQKVGTALMIIVIVLIGSMYYILQAALNTENPIVVVTSGSMEPVISEGDLLFIKYKDPGEIKNGTIENKEGDIILFDTRGAWSNPSDQYVVHRVVGKFYDDNTQSWYFYTKGDANPTVDPPGPIDYTPIPEDNIIGVVALVVPKLGWVKLYLDRNNLTIPLMVILGVLLVISIAWDLTHPEEDENEKNEKKKEREIDRLNKRIENRVRDPQDYHQSDNDDNVGDLGI